MRKRKYMISKTENFSERMTSEKKEKYPLKKLGDYVTGIIAIFLKDFV